MHAFISAHKHTILPSPPERGRGVGGEGAWHPCHRKADQRKWKGENTGTPAIHPCESALIRGSAQRLPGEFHPSPPSSLPFQGRGVPCALSSARTNTKCSPRPRNGGEGSGVRGQATQESPLQPADKPTRGCCANRRAPLWPLCSLWFKKHAGDSHLRASLAKKENPPACDSRRV